MFSAPILQYILFPDVVCQFFSHFLFSFCRTHAREVTYDDQKRFSQLNLVNWSVFLYSFSSEPVLNCSKQMKEVKISQGQ